MSMVLCGKLWTFSKVSKYEVHFKYGKITTRKNSVSNFHTMWIWLTRKIQSHIKLLLDPGYSLKIYMEFFNLGWRISNFIIKYGKNMVIGKTNFILGSGRAPKTFCLGDILKLACFLPSVYSY